MGDVLKSIADDLNEFSSFLKEAGIRKEFTNVGPYSRRAKFARAGFARGFRGRILVAYVGKELAVAKHVEEIDDIEREFEIALAVDKNISKFFELGKDSEPKKG